MLQFVVAYVLHALVEVFLFADAAWPVAGAQGCQQWRQRGRCRQRWTCAWACSAMLARRSRNGHRRPHSAQTACRREQAGGQSMADQARHHVCGQYARKIWPVDSGGFEKIGGCDEICLNQDRLKHRTLPMAGVFADACPRVVDSPHGCRKPAWLHSIGERLGFTQE